MKDKVQPPASKGALDLTYAEASRFLRLGLSRPDRPVDDLIKRLRQPDGAQWLASALVEVLGGSADSPGRKLLDPGTPLVELTQLKERSTDFARRASDSESWLMGMAGYFLSIGAALVHHSSLITSRSRDEVTRTLRQLAETTSPPWSSLLKRAAELVALLT